MNRVIETFKDTPLRNNEEAFELLESILKPFNITLDDAMLKDGGERTYTFNTPTCGTMRILVLCQQGAMPELAITADQNRPVMFMAMNNSHLMMKTSKPRTEGTVVVLDNVVRICRELVEWVRTVIHEYFLSRYVPA